jgi:cell division protein FtsI (penicillin-binding protein 3)
MFDEPKTSIYGGEVSAPVFGNIAKRYISLPRTNFLARNPDEAGGDENLLAGESNDGREDLPIAEIRFASAVEVSPGQDAGELLPDFRGRTIRDAYQLARSLGLDCEVYGGGLVENQEPVPGISVDGIDKITLFGK